MQLIRKAILALSACALLGGAASAQFPGDLFFADPSVSENIHEVEAEGTFGRLSFSIAGKGLPGNPRSSALTGMSVVAAIRRRVAPIRQ